MISSAKKISLTKAVSIRQYLGQCAIRLLFMDVDPFVLFSADVRAEKEARKVLDFSHFSHCMHIPACPLA